ncbi:MAG: HEPN domain-containing protein [Methylococcales bacterium]|jgi:CRISPR/Cas system Type II protein with McrA/HNH and RuvC-like nuclease domain|nr:HEPN domain-containing protein [Methylococcales bacterium]
MYAEKLEQFHNVENLGGKAWEHAVMIDLADKSDIKDCAMHCFHYQQMFELLLKHLLETQTEFGAYPHTHKLNKLLAQFAKETSFEVNSLHYLDALNTITVCAEAYRYNFLIDCTTYQRSIQILNPLLDELVEFANKK